jgi:hypothetical protein
MPATATAKSAGRRGGRVASCHARFLIRLLASNRRSQITNDKVCQRAVRCHHGLGIGTLGRYLPGDGVKRLREGRVSAGRVVPCVGARAGRWSSYRVELRAVRQGGGSRLSVRPGDTRGPDLAEILRPRPAEAAARGGVRRGAHAGIERRTGRGRFAPWDVNLHRVMSPTPRRRRVLPGDFRKAPRIDQRMGPGLPLGPLTAYQTIPS